MHLCVHTQHNEDIEQSQLETNQRVKIYDVNPTEAEFIAVKTERIAFRLHITRMLVPLDWLFSFNNVLKKKRERKRIRCKLQFPIVVIFSSPVTAVGLAALVVNVVATVRSIAVSRYRCYVVAAAIIIRIHYCYVVGVPANTFAAPTNRPSK